MFLATLESTQGQIDGFFGQLPYKGHLEEVAWHLWEIDLRFAINSTPGWLHDGMRRSGVAESEMMQDLTREPGAGSEAAVRPAGTRLRTPSVSALSRSPRPRRSHQALHLGFL